MQASVVRRPAVAGRFYPAKPELLARDLEAYLAPEPPSSEKVEKALGCVVPHAGYMYSGHVAGAVYRKLPAYDSYVILGPNHFGRGAPLATMCAGSWLTPLGTVPVDVALSEGVRAGCHLLADDTAAHAAEHSLEVQVPFLQHRFKNIRIVPIAVGQAGYAELELLGRGLAHAIQQAGKSVLMIASTDLNHYEPDHITRVKDRKAIDRVLAVDPLGLWDVLRLEDISMCGYGPTIVMLTAAKELGVRFVELVKYATSADAGGDPDAVVGYAGMIVW
jgi:AmmeMemoRadiSam system protein B